MTMTYKAANKHEYILFTLEFNTDYIVACALRSPWLEFAVKTPGKMWPSSIVKQNRCMPGILSIMLSELNY